ncbi:MAG: hypothetical protein V3T23_09395 [Nitrososphaerales archaeon]
MNKYPWFSHDNDAHEDDKHQLLIHQFGLAGYGAKWMLTELFDRHGVGDFWTTNIPYLMSKLRMRRKNLLELLLFLQKELGYLSEIFEEKVVISCPKLRKRQAKRKSKVPAILPKNKNKTKSKNKNKISYSSSKSKPRSEVRTDDAPLKLSKKGWAIVKELKTFKRVKLNDLSIIKVWLKSYPDIDMISELRKIEAWAASKVVTRKPKGWTRTVNTWLSKEQDKFKPGGNNGVRQTQAGLAQWKGGKFPAKKIRQGS